ncbi:hypothetical protein [Pseudonocardia sp.]|uniref:hypothetical protein n=1 Tax=Pseudonocardia sp. TaxID=60912 RepID=UPI00261C36EC|nr:hypothetical protein [Pseudonocardia sp.]
MFLDPPHHRPTARRPEPDALSGLLSRARCAATGGDRLHMHDDGPPCLRCAGLDHLVRLAAGDARRALDTTN